MNHPNSPARQSAGVRIGAIIAIAGVIALSALIVRELMPHHATAHAPTTAAGDDREAPPAPTVAPVPTVHAARPAPLAKPVVATAPAGSTNPGAAVPVPVAATIISQVAKNPEAFAPSNVFSPPAGKDELYNYEPLPPFNSTTLKRSRANPAAWELDAMRGPKMADLGPEGAVHQAALVKDSVGNETPWYVIDSGPLAPAYAVAQANTIRVMSRAFMIENRASLPPDVASALDK